MRSPSPELISPSVPPQAIPMPGPAAVEQTSLTANLDRSNRLALIAIRQEKERLVMAAVKEQNRVIEKIKLADPSSSRLPELFPINRNSNKMDQVWENCIVDINTTPKQLAYYNDLTTLEKNLNRLIKHEAVRNKPDDAKYLQPGIKQQVYSDLHNDATSFIKKYKGPSTIIKVVAGIACVASLAILGLAIVGLTGGAAALFPPMLANFITFFTVTELAIIAALSTIAGAMSTKMGFFSSQSDVINATKGILSPLRKVYGASSGETENLLKENQEARGNLPKGASTEPVPDYQETSLSSSCCR